MEENDYNPSMTRSISVIYATSTGNTEFVVDVLIESLAKLVKDARIVKQRAELTKAEDLTAADVLVLAAGSWNTANVEGQLQPHMYELLNVRAAATILEGKPAAAIGLGDTRYHFLARAAEKLTDWLKGARATILLPALTIINEPFDQSPKIEAWAGELAEKIAKLPLKP